MLNRSFRLLLFDMASFRRAVCLQGKCWEQWRQLAIPSFHLPCVSWPGRVYLISPDPSDVPPPALSQLVYSSTQVSSLFFLSFARFGNKNESKMRLIPVLGFLLTSVKGLRTGRGSPLLRLGISKHINKVGKSTAAVFPDPQDKPFPKHNFLNTNSTSELSSSSKVEPR